MELIEILNCYDKNVYRWEHLVKLYEKFRIVPFIGAGMSAPIYPQWKRAILNILNGSKEEKEIVEQMLNNNRYEEACEYVKEIIGPNGFRERVCEEFSIDKITKESEENRKKVNSRYLVDVFKGPVFTTNFDKTIEYFYSNSFDNSYNLSNMTSPWSSIYNAIKQYKHNIYKIHGDIDDNNSLVFTKQEYDDVYKREEFVEAIETVYKYMGFLFMGCSLSKGDRYLELFSNVTNSLNKGDSILNFAFVSLPNDNNKTLEQFNNEIEERDRYLSELGIFPIWYPCDKHEAITVLLNALKRGNTASAIFKGDETGKEKHFNLFSSRISVKDAFVDDCFDTYIYSGIDATSFKPIKLEEIIELVKTRDLLYIEGDYGSGKTVLSTMIQWELKKIFKTLYFNSETFIKNTEITDQLISFNERCFVFIDGLDRLIDIDINLTKLNNICDKIANIIEKKNNITFVVTSRMYCHIGQKKVDDLISMYVTFTMNREELVVIRTKGFFEKSKYEEFFSKINTDKINVKNLTAKRIKEWHKKSPNSCQVPLFAYAIGTYFYEKQKNSKSIYNDVELLPDNKMIVYEDFVEKTIKGRFKEESISGTINKQLYDKYETLLQNIAIRMIRKMRDNINYQEDVFKAQDFSKQEAYEVNIKEFSEEIQRLLQEVVNESRLREVWLSDAINNYFFIIKESESDNELLVRFSDLNVMSCFAAKYIFDVIIEIANCKDCNIKNFYESIIEKLGMVELQPQVMDFLMCKIDALSYNVLDSLLNNILKLITIYNQEQINSEEIVRAVLLLYIVFIKFWKTSYKSSGIPNFFKTFYRLCMTAKALNLNGKHKEGSHRYLVERYFMNCSFIDYQFKRLNYKYYNFSKSQIICSSFEQCNFLDNEFMGAYIKNSIFKLCTIKTKLENTIINGIFKIENSILNDVVLDNIQQYKKGSTLIFRGCTIVKMLICNTDNRLLKIIFENCIISDLKIKNTKGLAIEINDCVVKNTISIDANSIVYSNGTDYFDKSVKSLDNLEYDDFRALSHTSLL